MAWRVLALAVLLGAAASPPRLVAAEFDVPFGEAVVYAYNHLAEAAACKDATTACASWALDGECVLNDTNVPEDCPASCGLCEGVGDEDIRSWMDAVLYGLRNARRVLELLPEAEKSPSVHASVVSATHEVLDLAERVFRGASHRNEHLHFRHDFHRLVQRSFSVLRDAVTILSARGQTPGSEGSLVHATVHSGELTMDPPTQDGLPAARAAAVEPALKLKTGAAFPSLGFGTTRLSLNRTRDEAAAVVMAALAAGYERIDVEDSAATEAAVGQALAALGAERKRVYLSLALHLARDMDLGGLVAAKLARLGVAYIDCLVLEGDILTEPSEAMRLWPVAAQLLLANQVRALGVRDVDIDELEALVAAGIEPHVLQHKWWPLHHGSYINQGGIDVVAACHRHGIVLDGYGLLTSHPHKLVPQLDPHVLRVARDTGKSASQVLLRWALQSGVAATPSSTAAEHIEANLQALNEGFALTAEQETALSGLAWFVASVSSRPASFDCYGVDPEYESTLQSDLPPRHDDL